MRKLVAALISVVVATTGLTVGADATPGSPWEERRVLNVAHAGGDLEAPHSTLFAMKTAVAAGTDVLEMDVRLSADGVLMVHHDPTIDRTTEASGDVRDFTAAELRALDNAYWFVPNCWSCKDLPDEAYGLRGIRTGERHPPEGFEPDDFTIPTLAEVAGAFPNRILDVEIKDGLDGVATAEALAAFIAEHGQADRYLVASFDDAVLDRFKGLAPDVATSPGLDTMTNWFATRGPLAAHQVLQVPPEFSGIEVVTQQFVDDAHEAGLAVWVWFNGNDDDSPAVWQHLIDLGVDALVTGRPAAAEAVIDANDVGFSVAPETGPTATVTGHDITVQVTCPSLHVDTCSGSLVVMGADRQRRRMLVGIETVEVVRGDSAAVDVGVRPGTRRAVRHGTDITVGIVPTDGDTAGALAPATIRR